MGATQPRFMQLDSFVLACFSEALLLAMVGDTEPKKADVQAVFPDAYFCGNPGVSFGRAGRGCQRHAASTGQHRAKVRSKGCESVVQAQSFSDLMSEEGTGLLKTYILQFETCFSTKHKAMFRCKMQGSLDNSHK